MRANQLKSILLIATFSLFLAACEQVKPPEEVSLRFWQAVKSGNISKVKMFTVEKDIELPPDLALITDVKTGRIIIDGNNASVETLLTIQEEQLNKVFVLETLLVKKDGKWQVNYDATMEQFVVEDEVDALIEGLQELGEQATEVLSESIEQMADVLPEVREEIERVEQEMKEALPEFKEKLKGVLDSLEEALEKLPDTVPQEGKPGESETADIEQHQI